MLPIILFNMDHSQNTNPNSNFGMAYDESVILNSTRSRKKVSELPNCPVCCCTIRNGELEAHLAVELDKLQKISCCAKRKLSNSSSGSSLNLAVPGSSSETPADEVDVSGCIGSHEYRRIRSNRLRRLRARSRQSPLKTGECPVCSASIIMSKLHRHTLRCLKRSGASIDEELPDSSSDEGSIDVENDSPSTNSFGAEYEWCGEVRVRATALQDPQANTAIQVRRSSNEDALVVDHDEDTELYGPAQYSPSAIAPEEPDPNLSEEMRNHSEEDEETPEKIVRKPNGIIEASVETRIQALKERIKELESRQHSAKCLICLGPYTSPAVSIQCWHVYCETCWLDSLRAKKICPQCNLITTTQHLRRIYM